MITYEEIRKNEDIRTYIQSADEALAALRNIPLRM